MIAIDEVEIIELLQHEMRRIEQQARARMVVDRGEEAFPGRAVMDVLAGMDLERAIDAHLFEHVEDRSPATGEFGERFLDQPGGTLRPRIHVRPSQCAREGGMRGQAEIGAGARGELDLLDRPKLALGGLAVNFGGREAVEQRVVCRMHRDQLPLQMRRQFGDFNGMFGEAAAKIVAIGLALGGELQVDQLRIAGDLDADVTEPRRPFGQRVERIERGCVAEELGEEYPGALHAGHAALFLVSSRKVNWNSSAITAAAIAGYHHICCQSAMVGDAGSCAYRSAPICDPSSMPTP